MKRDEMEIKQKRAAWHLTHRGHQSGSFSSNKTNKQNPHKQNTQSMRSFGALSVTSSDVPGQGMNLLHTSSHCRALETTKQDYEADGRIQW